MSTIYYLRKPLTDEEFSEKARGWKPEKTDEKIGDSGWTDGMNWAWVFRDLEGRIEGFERFGSNRVNWLVKLVDAVSEHDRYDPDYARLFPEDVD